MNKAIFSLCLVLPVSCFASWSREETTVALTNQFADESSLDQDSPGLADAMARAHFEDDLGGIAASSGWTRDQLISQCGIIATNLFERNGLHTNTMDQMIFDGAIGKIGRWGDTNSLPVLDYLIRHANNRQAGGALSSYINIAGFLPIHQPYYLGLMSGTNALPINNFGGAFTAFCWSEPTNTAPAVTTNFINRLLLALADRNDVVQVGVDQNLCERWVGYSSSSNRLRQVVRVLGSPQNSIVSSYFLPIQAQLNAATNLVELSTNDFLNAGE